MSIVELPSQTASDRCEQPDQTAAIRGARLSELETPVKLLIPPPFLQVRWQD